MKFIAPFVIVPFGSRAWASAAVSPHAAGSSRLAAVLPGALVAAALALSAGGARAQVYLEGQASLGKAPKSLCNGLSSCKTSSLDGRVTLGYGVGNGVGVEVGAAGYGMAKAGNDTTGLKRKAGGAQLGLSYRHPMSQEATLDLRGGVTRARLSTDSWINKIKAGGKDVHTTGPYVGLGMSYQLAEGLSLGGMVDLAQLKVDSKRKGFVNLGVTLRKTF